MAAVASLTSDWPFDLLGWYAELFAFIAFSLWVQIVQFRKIITPFGMSEKTIVIVIPHNDSFPVETCFEL